LLNPYRSKQLDALVHRLSADFSILGYVGFDAAALFC
jgi:hypothetical protein